MSRATIPILLLLAWLTVTSCIDRGPVITSVSIEEAEFHITTGLGAFGSQVDQVWLIAGRWGAERGQVLRELERRAKWGSPNLEDVLGPKISVLHQSEVKPGAHWKVEEQFRIPLSTFPVGGKEELWVVALLSGWPVDAVRIDEMLKAHNSDLAQGQAGAKGGK